MGRACIGGCAMSLFDIYKAKKLGAGAGSLFNMAAGKKMHPFESFNKWDEEWEEGNISSASGSPTVLSGKIRATHYIPVIPNTKYYLYCGSGLKIGLFGYDENKSYVGTPSANWETWTPASGFNDSGNVEFTIPENVYFLKFCSTKSYGATYKNDICINVSSSRNGEYHPYGEP